MDIETIAIYDNEAENICQLHSTLIPIRIYELIEKNFIKHAVTADVGCGIGRDTHWLNQQGFQTIGVDASKQMLKQAMTLYPNDKFIHDSLPELPLLADSKFQNILCSAVLMHLKKNDFVAACLRLFELLNKKGCLIVSFRGTNETDNREKGKLYRPIAVDEFLAIFRENGCNIVLQEKEMEISRNLVWNNFVIFK
jgi:2-polyprenyl-3-methyl-5-hydroxy-6-metoxy-1,4-benzoquinol methylase